MDPDSDPDSDLDPTIFIIHLQDTNKKHIFKEKLNKFKIGIFLDFSKSR